MTELLLAASAALMQLTAASYSVVGVRQPSSLIFGECLQTFKRQIAAPQLPFVASLEQQRAYEPGRRTCGTTVTHSERVDREYRSALPRARNR